MINYVYAVLSLHKFRRPFAFIVVDIMLLLSYFYLICIAPINALLDVELIQAFFAYKHVQYGSIYTCMTRTNQIEFMKTFINANISLSVYNIDDDRFDINSTYVFIQKNMHLGMVLDGECAFSSAFLARASVCEVFTDVHHWLVFLQSKEKIYEYFEDIVMTVSTDLQVAVPDEETLWKLYDVYNPAKTQGGKLNVTFYNNFTNGEIKRWRKKEHLYWDRRNMTGVIFKGMIVLPKNFSGELDDYLYNDDNREVNTFNRFQGTLHNHIKDYYYYKINASRTLSWGYKLPNGSFDGMVRALEHRLIDFGISPLFVKDERWPVIDYGRRSWLLKSAFIFRMPKRPASFEVFLRPLDGPVWYWTVVAMIAIIVMMKITLEAEYAFVKRIILHSFDAKWSSIILFALGSICQQGTADTPTALCSRILFIFSFIFAVLLYQYYSASIVAILVMTPARIINDLRDLAMSTLKLGCEDTLYNRDYIGKLTSDPVVSILEKKAPSQLPFYTEPEIGLKQVAKGGYAFLIEVATAYPIIEETFDEDTICSLDEVQLFRTQQMHQPVPKHSPFREMLNHVLHKIDESGMMKRQIKHWHARKPECIRSRPPTSPVSLEEFYPALSVLVIGLFLSVFILLVEYFVAQNVHKRNLKKLIKKYKNQPKSNTM